MSEQTLNQIKRLLRDLDKDELKEVQLLSINKIKTKSSVASRLTKDNSDRDFLYELTCQIIQNRTGKRPPHLPIFLRTKDGKKYLEETLESFNDFVNYTLRDQAKKRSIRSKMYTLLATLVIENLEQMGVEVTTKTVLKNLQRGPALFNVAFPGYIQSGLTHMVLQ